MVLIVLVVVNRGIYSSHCRRESTREESVKRNRSREKNARHVYIYRSGEGDFFFIFDPGSEL